MHLFIIPGNPPAVHFYRLWAEEICRKRKECTVHISPYPRLPANEDSSRYLNDMAEIHAKELLAFHRAAKEKVFVIGHSLGGWMALRLLEKHPDAIEKCLLLYPFLKRPSFKGRAILQLGRALYKVPFFQEALLSCRSFLERFVSDLTYVTDNELLASFSLVYHEQKIIGRHKETLHIPEPMREKLHMIYCDQDAWCPPETVDEMKQWISSEKLPTMHGFITSAKERAIVLEALLQKVL
ncbi:MAG: alpha/beta fold hydrolase [Verrucomicrobia bacterium]|nr:alpha/beta fold hydrolase [Verrucomicrobiota bacterium]